MTNDPKLDKQPPAAPEGDEDTEGHSLAIVAGMNAMSRTRQDEAKRSSAKDDDLKPLSKPFPSMKDESRK